MSRYQQLSQDERYTISALRGSRHSDAQVARALHRSPSTISRELRRNRCAVDGAYRLEFAHDRAVARRKRVRRGFRHSPQQWRRVVALLKKKWSPEQISNHLRLKGAFDISHETIYCYILHDKRHGGSLFRHLRGSQKRRRKRYNSRDSRGILPGKRSISQRPPGVESRKSIGHWEADTMIGTDLHHGLLTLVERKSGLAVIRKITSRTTESVNQAALRVLRRHHRNFRTLTLDNGSEFHGYKELERRYRLKCYFATPYHSWERGSNENLNGLIRQYLPKRTSLRNVTQTDCDYIALQLNSRPRKRHDYETPQEVFDAQAK
jgi:transposase, IS30 family